MNHFKSIKTVLFILAGFYSITASHPPSATQAAKAAVASALPPAAHQALASAQIYSKCTGKLGSGDISAENKALIIACLQHGRYKDPVTKGGFIGSIGKFITNLLNNTKVTSENSKTFATAFLGGRPVSAEEKAILAAMITGAPKNDLIYIIKGEQTPADVTAEKADLSQQIVEAKKKLKTARTGSTALYNAEKSITACNKKLRELNQLEQRRATPTH